MPLFTLDIEKRLSSEFWTNRYIVETASLAETVLFAADVVAYERSFHNANVSFTRFRASTLASGDDVYSIVPINQAGLRNPPAQLLPLFNTLRLDITAQTGRPSRKYYRGVLTEQDIAGDVVNEAFPTVASDLTALLKGAEIDPFGIVGPQGETLVQAVLFPFVQMRQLRRSRRRRASGGIFQ